jgi:hypothetical protein
MNHLDLKFGQARMLSVSARSSVDTIKTRNAEEQNISLFPNTSLLVYSQSPAFIGRGTKLEKQLTFGNVSGSFFNNGKRKSVPYDLTKSVFVPGTDGNPAERNFPFIWPMDQIKNHTSAEVADYILGITNNISNSLEKLHDAIDSSTELIEISVADGRDTVFRFAGPFTEDDLKEMRIVFITIEDYIFRRHPKMLWESTKNRSGKISYSGKWNTLGENFFRVAYGIDPIKHRTSKFLAFNSALFLAGAIIGEKFVVPEIVENTIIGEITFDLKYNPSTGYEIWTKPSSTNGYFVVTNKSYSEGANAELEDNYVSDNLAVEFVLSDSDSDPPRLNEFNRGELANPASLCKFHLSIDDSDDDEDFEITGCDMIYDGVSPLDIERDRSTFSRGIRVEGDLLSLSIAPIFRFKLSKPVSAQALLRKINTSTLSLQTTSRVKSGDEPIFFEDHNGRTNIVHSADASDISYQVRERKLPTLKNFKIDELRKGVKLDV